MTVSDPADSRAATAPVEAPAEPPDEAPASTAVPLLEPRDGLPDVITTRQALAAAAEALASGTGPIAVDA